MIERNLLKIMLQRAAKRNIKSYPQMVCFSHDTISQKIFIDGLFEKRELLALKAFLDEELNSFESCLDIGANIGNHSLFFSKIFQRVLSFEPNQETFRLLAINAGLANNIRAVNVGLGSKSATLAASFDPLNRGGAAISESSDANLTFEIIALDDYLSETDEVVISFIKMDVEGHELEALKGAVTTLKKYCPVLALELHAKKEPAKSLEILSFLDHNGYKHAHVFEANFFSQRKPRFVKSSLNQFGRLLKKNHKMVLFTAH